MHMDRASLDIRVESRFSDYAAAYQFTQQVEEGLLQQHVEHSIISECRMTEGQQTGRLSPSVHIDSDSSTAT